MNTSWQMPQNSWVLQVTRVPRLKELARDSEVCAELTLFCITQYQLPYWESGNKSTMHFLQTILEKSTIISVAYLNNSMATNYSRKELLRLTSLLQQLIQPYQTGDKQIMTWSMHTALFWYRKTKQRRYLKVLYDPNRYLTRMGTGDLYLLEKRYFVYYILILESLETMKRFVYNQGYSMNTYRANNNERTSCLLPNLDVAEFPRRKHLRIRTRNCTSSLHVSVNSTRSKLHHVWLHSTNHTSLLEC